ncbi:MAG: hypothetical protein H0V82_06000 [Candidatus Protochlamydia sp.]|nr:hypothetical protein [Candidatus Protochlamydia sp.]
MSIPSYNQNLTPPTTNTTTSTSTSTSTSTTTFTPTKPVESKDIVKISEGNLILPNGQAYKIGKIKLGGKEINLDNPLNETQLKAIKTVADQIFKQLRDVSLENSDLETVMISSKSEQISVETKHTDKEKDKSEQLENNNFTRNLITEEFQKAFPRPSNKNVEPPNTIKNVESPDPSFPPDTNSASKVNILPTDQKIVNVMKEQAQIITSNNDLIGIPGLEKPLTVTTVLEGPNSAQRSESATISQEYVLEDGTVVGKQTIHRFDTITDNTLFCNNMVNVCKAKLENPLLTEDEKDTINADLNYYQKALVNSEKYHEESTNKSWQGSTYFRDIISEAQSFFSGIQNYVSGPINMRHQKFEGADGKTVGFIRTGIISDMRNGWFSLTDLKVIKEQGNQRSSTFLDEKIKYIESQINPQSFLSKLFGGPLKGKQLESANFALNQLKMIKAGGIDEIVNERKLVLQQQMIHLVINQVRENPELIKEALNTGNFDIVHVSLLNQYSSGIDKTGWMHDERVEMEDMQEIFKEFQGKTLLFDGKGPSIDENKISLPKDCLPVGVILPVDKEIKLRTNFFNLSVQGDTKNDGAQLRINKEAIENLKKFISERDPSNQGPLPGGVSPAIIADPTQNSGYGIAEDFISYLLSKKMAVSLGCLSAKDRTGFISERLMLKQLKDEATQLFFAPNVFKKEWPPVKVLLENTPDYAALKVTPTAEWRGFTNYQKLVQTIFTIFNEFRTKGMV